jgi:DNA-binding transcriptional regulator YiaG
MQSDRIKSWPGSKWSSFAFGSRGAVVADRKNDSGDLGGRREQMKKSVVKTTLSEFRSVERGDTAPARVREVTLLPDGKIHRVELDPETYRRKQARAWKPKTEAAKVRHELNLTQDAFAELLCVSLATVRKWDRGTGEPSGAAKTLLEVARINPEVVREAGALVVGRGVGLNDWRIE